MGAAHPKSSERRKKDSSWVHQKHLYRRFCLLSGGRSTLRQEDLQRIPDLQSNPIGARIIRAFFDQRNLRTGPRGLAPEITFQDFLTVIGYFRPAHWAGSPEEAERLREDKMRFLFHMYDADFDGLVSLEEYGDMVEELLFGSLEAEERDRTAGRDIARGAMREAAAAAHAPGKRGQEYPGISFQDFQKTWQGIDVLDTMKVSFLSLQAHAFPLTRIVPPWRGAGRLPE